MPKVVGTFRNAWKQLRPLDPADIDRALKIATRIPGLGVAGGSGLLSVLDPEHFGTVDQFVVKALQGVGGLSHDQEAAVATMNPEGLSIKNGVRLIEILREKAAALSDQFERRRWTPRMVDMVLWTYGRA